MTKTRRELGKPVAQTSITRDWMKNVKQMIERRLSPLEEPVSGVGDSVIQACQEIINACTNDKQREERLVKFAHKLRDADTAILLNDSEDDEDMTMRKGGSAIIQQRNQAEVQRRVDMQEVIRQIMIVQRRLNESSATHPTVGTSATVLTSPHSTNRPPPGGILMIEWPPGAESLTVDQLENVQFCTNDTFWKWKEHIRVVSGGSQVLKSDLNLWSF